jgi:DNA-binding MarR family transcriptional regulator
MKLEDEIKQGKFRNEFQKLIINLIYTGGWINGRNSEFLKPFGLTNQQYNLLRILRGQYPEPATVNLLIDRMLDKMSNASRIVDKLITKKLVERKACSGDRRCVDVIITDKGLKLIQKIEIEEKNWESLSKNLSLSESKQLNKLLDKLRG